MHSKTLGVEFITSWKLFKSHPDHQCYGLFCLQEHLGIRIPALTEVNALFGMVQGLL